MSEQTAYCSEHCQLEAIVAVKVTEPSRTPGASIARVVLRCGAPAGIVMSQRNLAAVRASCP